MSSDYYHCEKLENSRNGDSFMLSENDSRFALALRNQIRVNGCFESAFLDMRMKKSKKLEIRTLKFMIGN